MKKKGIVITLVTGILLTGGIYLRQRNSESLAGKNVPKTTVVFLKDSVDFGTFPYAEIKRAVVRFLKTGEHPLIIKNAVSSCGCAEVNWNKRPVAPGQTDSLTVSFTPNSLGQFNKSVELTCNTVPDNHLLHLKGFVEE